MTLLAMDGRAIKLDYDAMILSYSNLLFFHINAFILIV